MTLSDNPSFLISSSSSPLRYPSPQIINFELGITLVTFLNAQINISKPFSLASRPNAPIVNDELRSASLIFLLSTSRLWREVVQDMAKNKFSDIKVNYLFVDNAAMKIITNPSEFDVILTENMFGDIITDEASVITGSLGMLPSASIGNKISLFEPIHGSYPQAAGKNIANPMAMILSAAMMLNLAFDMKKEADIIQNSVRDALDSNIVTEDISSKKSLSTSEVGDWISKRIDVLF